MTLFLRLDVVRETTGSASPSFDRHLVEGHDVTTARALAVLQFDG